MHILFIHKNFPAHFGHIAQHLLTRQEWQCSFACELPNANIQGINRIQYAPIGGATMQTPYLSRSFVNAVAHAEGVHHALKAREDIRPDLVVAHAGFGSSLFLRQLYEAPIVNHFEYYYHAANSDLDFWPDHPPGESKQLRVSTRNAMILLDLENCDAGYSPTAYQRELFPSVYQSRLHTIFDGIDTAVFKPRPGIDRRIGDRVIPDHVRLVTYCARGFERMRGFDMFIRAAREISHRHPDVLFVVVGSDRVVYGDGKAEAGNFSSFRERVLSEEEVDLSRFIFTGLVPPRELADLFAISDAHIYLTAPFVLGWSMLNAMACGAPVVGSDTAPVREFIVDEETGLLADFFEPEAIADQVTRLLQHPEDFVRVRQNAVEMVQREYSLEAVLPQMIGLFQQVAD